MKEESMPEGTNAQALSIIMRHISVAAIFLFLQAAVKVI